MRPGARILVLALVLALQDRVCGGMVGKIKAMFNKRGAPSEAPNLAGSAPEPNAPPMPAQPPNQPYNPQYAAPYGAPPGSNQQPQGSPHSEMDEQSANVDRSPGAYRDDDALMRRCHTITQGYEQRYECVHKISERMPTMLRRHDFPKSIIRVLQAHYRAAMMREDAAIVDVRDPIAAWNFVVAQRPERTEDGALQDLERAFQFRFDTDRATLLPAAVRAGAIATAARLLGNRLAPRDPRIDANAIFDVLVNGRVDMMRWLDYYHQDVACVRARWYALLERHDLPSDVLDCILIVAYRMGDGELASILANPRLSPSARRVLEQAYNHPVRVYNQRRP